MTRGEACGEDIAPTGMPAPSFDVQGTVLIQAMLGVFAMAADMLGFGLALKQGVPTGLGALIGDMLPLGF